MADVLTVVAKIRAVKGKGDALAALLKEQVAVVTKAEPGCLDLPPASLQQGPRPLHLLRAVQGRRRLRAASQGAVPGRLPRAPALNALETVTGGFARELLRDGGSAVGGALDDVGNSLIQGTEYVGGRIAAGGRAIANAAVATSDAVRTGVGNGLNWAGNQLKGAGAFVQPSARR